MLTSFKNHLNWEDTLYIFLSNFALDDPRESGGDEIEMHSAANDFMFMATYK
jgi:hypothetical protein